MFKTNFTEKNKIYIFILLVSLIYQGIIIFTNNYSEDSTLLIYELDKADYHPFFDKFINDSKPLTLVFHSLVSQYSNNYILTYKLFGLLSFCGSALLVFSILIFFKIKRSDALFITLITIALPNYYQWSNLIFSHYSFAYFLLLLGINLYLNFLKRRKLHLLFIAFSIFTISFLIPSNLVFIYVFLLSLFLLHYKKDLSFIKNSLKFIKIHILLIIIPFIYRFIVLFLYPLKNNYYSINPTLKGVVIRTYQGFFKIILEIIKPLISFFKNPSEDLFFFGVIFLISALTLFLIILKTKKYIFNDNSKKEKIIYILYGGFMLFMAFFPFLMIRKLGHHRNPLIIIPISLSLFYLIRLIVPKYSKLILYFILFCFSIVVFHAHIVRQNRFLERQSVMLNLKELNPESDVLVFKNIHAIFYEWNVMLKQTFPNDNKLGFNYSQHWFYNDQAEFAKYGAKELYLIPKILPDFNKKIFVEVNRNTNLSQIEIFWKYLTLSEQEYEAFLMNIISLEIFSKKQIN